MGFKLKENKYLKNIDSNVFLYEHDKTKAQLLYFANNDVNKSFSITFKTIPYNDNGIFHILEHSVLCGSEKYPVKEPFVELIKGSFNTFLNAMTFPDKTIYPVSSKNDEDLKILMDIYLDAVFNPKLKNNDKILQQEGWHYHLENINDKLIYKGVVYNEMKGAYSSVDESLDQRISEVLFNETAYKYSSGGKPEFIPSITQEEFLKTYNNCYHPSNSFITLYGDMDINKYLDHIEIYLNNYDEKNYDDYNITLQNYFDKNINNFEYFNDDDNDKDYFAINYIIGTNKDINATYSIEIIDELLLGNSNTPFRKYFIDNDICEDVYSYIQRDRLEVVYSIIFKNIKKEYVEKLPLIYDDQLLKFINDKFDYEQIKASINKNKFIIKEEVNKTSSPKGVTCAIRALRNWLYNEDPFEIFEYDNVIKILEDNYNNKCYEDIATKYLLNNKKVAKVQLIANNTLSENDNLDTYKDSLNYEQLISLQNNTKTLIDWQNSKDNYEDLKKIKSIDAKKVNLKKPYNKIIIKDIENIISTHYDTNTNDIIYSNLLFDITSFTKEDLQLASLLSYLLFNINTKNKTELEIAKEIDANLGSISSTINIFKNDKTGDIKLKYIISSKNLEDKLSELISILEENTKNIVFDNKQAIYNILLELKLSLEFRFKNAGHSFINSRLGSYYSHQMQIVDYITGYDFYMFIKDIVIDFDKKFNILSAKLNDIVKKIFNRNNIILNCIGDNNNYKSYTKHILNYVNSLSDNGKIIENTIIPFEEKDNNYSEGYFFDTLVQYVGVGKNIENYSGSLLVLRHIINFDYLWSNIRIKGGAYGAGMTLNKFGDLSFYSYRDPNLNETLSAYYNIVEYIRNIDLDDETLNKYIIGTLNSFDQLLSPVEKGKLALNQYINDSDVNSFDQLVKEIKETTVTQLRSLANYFEELEENSYKCIIGTKEIINNNKDIFNEIIEIK